MALLKSKKALDWKKMRNLPPRKMHVYFKSAGYFRQKSETVKFFIEFIVVRMKGKLGDFLHNKTIPLRKLLLDLKGIGMETADSMLLYAGGHPVFVVDAYTKRIGSRWGLFHENEKYEKVQEVFVSALPRSANLYGEYHALLVKLAKNYCRKKEPFCSQCPLQRKCKFGLTRPFR